MSVWRKTTFPPVTETYPDCARTRPLLVPHLPSGQGWHLGQRRKDFTGDDFNLELCFSWSRKLVLVFAEEVLDRLLVRLLDRHVERLADKPVCPFIEGAHSSVSGVAVL